MAWDNKDLFTSNNKRNVQEGNCLQCNVHGRVNSTSICNQCYWDNITAEKSSNSIYETNWGHSFMKDQGRY